MKSSPSTKIFSALVLALPALGIAHSCRAMSSILVTRASGLRHDVVNRIGPLKLDHQAGSSALRSRNAPNPRKGVSRARPSNGDPSTRHCTGTSRLALKPRRSVLRTLRRGSSLQAGSFRAHLSKESSCVPGPAIVSSPPTPALPPGPSLASIGMYKSSF